LEGLGRKLGRWRRFGCDGFKIHGKKVAESADERELLKRHSWRTEEGEEEEGEA